MLWGLRLVDEHHGFGGKRRYLSYHLTANATCRTCNQNFLAFEHSPHRLQIYVDFITRQQVVDAD